MAVAAEEAEDLDGLVVGGSEPVGVAGVELGHLSGFHDDFVVGEDEPHFAGDDEEPFAAFVGSQLRFAGLGRDDDFPRLGPVGLLRQRDDGAPVAALGVETDAGVADWGAGTSWSRGMPCAWEMGRSSSRLGLRCPDSSRDRVLLEIPGGGGQLSQGDPALLPGRSKAWPDFDTGSLSQAATTDVSRADRVRLRCP